MATDDRDRLDQWLDQALRQSEIARPRPGLERRVLARIAAESKRHRAQKSWVWILATASAALLAVIGLGVRHHSGEPPNPAVPQGSRNSVVARVAIPLPPVIRNRSHGKRTPALARTTDEPKLEHFPSRRPLSEQERLLASYATRFPAEAALIAREQEKFEQEIARAQEEAENDSSHSNQ